jgi:hypothetical protein
MPQYEKALPVSEFISITMDEFEVPTKFRLQVTAMLKVCEIQYRTYVMYANSTHSEDLFFAHQMIAQMNQSRDRIHRIGRTQKGNESSRWNLERDQIIPYFLLNVFGTNLR